MRVVNFSIVPKALCEQAHKRKTSGTADFLYEIDEIVSSIVNGVPRKRYF